MKAEGSGKSRLNYVVTKPQKSVGIAILLTLFFDPIGLFCASVTGGLVIVFGPVILLVVMIFGLMIDNPLRWGSSLMLILFLILFWWLICMVWAAIGVSSYNSRIVREAQEEHMLYQTILTQGPQRDSVSLGANKMNRSLKSGFTTENSFTDIQTKPSLETWLKENLGKSVNDYFRTSPN